MDKKSKYIIILLIYTIILLSILLIKVTYTYLNSCKIIGYSLSITQLEYEKISRKNAIQKESELNAELVKLTVEDITNKGVTLIIKDGNKEPYNWTETYILKKKINNEYIELEGDNNFDLTKITLNQNGEYKQVINWKDTYGELEPGIYVIEKIIITTNSTINFMTEEFKI